MEWIDPKGVDEARRHIACVSKLARTPRANRRAQFLLKYLDAIDVIYGPQMSGPNGLLGRPLSCKYKQVRYGRLYCTTHQGPKKEDDTYPRYICAQGMPSILRTYLLRHFVHDIDIQNCHVSLMYQLGAKVHEWQEHKGKMAPLALHTMKELYEHRNKFIEHVADAHHLDKDSTKWEGYRKDLIKGLLLRIMYGGSYDSWMEENGIYGMKVTKVLRLQAELDRLRDVILQSSQFKDIIDAESLAQRRKQTNVERVRRGVFSKIAQHLECKVLLAMKDFLETGGYKVHSLIFDGLTVEHAKDMPDLKKMEAHIQNSTGFSVQIVEKPLYYPVEDLDFGPLCQWITGHPATSTDTDFLLCAMMNGVEDAAKKRPKADKDCPIYMQGYLMLR